MGKTVKQSTLDALNRYSQRQLDEAKPREVKHYGKPEKEVEKECLELMRSWGWSVQIIESKANWNGQSWVQQGAKQGTADCLGSTDEGIAAAIEFKAPGRLSTFNSERRYHQRKFIVDKINANNFACVVDSASRLKLIYETWKERRKINPAAAREYLISMLPQMNEKTGLKEEPLFDE